MEDLIFISSALQQPRHQKRIDLFSTKFNLTVFYFFRNKYTENYKNYKDSALQIGSLKDGKYSSRLFLLIKLYFLLRKSKISKVYCTSPDQALMSILAGKKTYLEVGDLYQIDGRNKIYKILDSYTIPRISGLILTSPYFYQYYFIRFKKHLDGKVVVVENKLAIDLDSSILKYRKNFKSTIDISHLKIGIIGSLIFKKSLNLINDFIVEKSNVELHIYGDGLVSIFENTENAHYHGRFRSPEDLKDIYSNIDINIILYDYDNNNVKLALPNKLYESIAYLKPIICASEVALSKYVVESGIGVVVKDNDLSSAVEEILRNYDFYVQNLKNMSKETYLCFEQDEIINLIQSI